jgi:hypothetical protein
MEELVGIIPIGAFTEIEHDGASRLPLWCHMQPH